MINDVVFVVTGSGLRDSVARDLARGRSQSAVVTVVSAQVLLDQFALDEHLLFAPPTLVISSAVPISASLIERAALRFRHDTIQAYRRMAEPVLVRTPALLFATPRVPDLARGHEFLREIKA